MKVVLKYCFGCVALLWALSLASAAQTDATTNPAEQPEGSAQQKAPESVFPHQSGHWFWFSGQMNFIYQTHPPFHAEYSGRNSMSPDYEKATSRVLTLYTGARLNDSTEVLADVEESGGRGISDALGLAGFSNLDVVRNPTLSKAPYLSRVMFHKVFSLGGKTTESDRGPLSTLSKVPERRLDVRVGKFSVVDFFDVNAVGSDSHLQFMNWATAQNGAYDYAADTRGYTWGAVVEYQQQSFAFRVGEMLMPKVANALDEVWNLRKAHSENFELELRRTLIPHRTGTIRLLSFINHANMGVYQQAVAAYEAGITPVPDITAHPWHTTMKYGFGLNIEQSLSSDVKAFMRVGWNNGKTESFVYTEIDNTLSFGATASGHMWHRNQDRTGVAFASNGISQDHQSYLAHGGLGFIIGDGALSYGRETAIEAFYTAHMWRGVYLGPDLQHVNNPGFNRVRGPVLIPGFRVHVEL